MGYENFLLSTSHKFLSKVRALPNENWSVLFCLSTRQRRERKTWKVTWHWIDKAITRRLTSYPNLKIWSTFPFSDNSDKQWVFLGYKIVKLRLLGGINNWQMDFNSKVVTNPTYGKTFARDKNSKFPYSPSYTGLWTRSSHFS